MCVAIVISVSVGGNDRETLARFQVSLSERCLLSVGFR